MFYTPGQLRDSVGLSKEAFRHWKRVLPAFASGRGHAPSFSPGDVLASAVLRRVTEIAGVRISHLSQIAPAIFVICNRSGWEVLQDQLLVINLSEQTCFTVTDPSPIPEGELVLVCALAPIIQTLKHGFLTTRSEPRLRIADAPLLSSDRRKVSAR